MEEWDLTNRPPKLVVRALEVKENRKAREGAASWLRYRGGTVFEKQLQWIVE